MLRFGDYHSWPEVAGSTDPAGRRGPVRSAEAEQGLKRRHGLAPAIVTEDELVEVDGKLGAADAMVGATQPRSSRGGRVRRVVSPAPSASTCITRATRRRVSRAC